MKTHSIKRYILGLFLLGLVGVLPGKDRSIVRVGSDIVVEKDMEVESAVAIGADIIVYGVVDESAVAVGGSIYLKPDAVVREDAVSIGGDIIMEAGAEVRGDLVEVDDFNISGFFNRFGPHLPWHMPWHGPWFFPWYSLVGFIALGLIIVLLVPRQVDLVTTTLEKETLKSLLFGLLACILFIPAVVAMAVSVLGIPLIPVLIIVALLAAVIGYLAVSNLLGRRTLATLNKPTPTTVVATLLGLVILALVGLIPLLGWMIKSLVALLGFGAVLVAVIKKGRRAAPVEAESGA